MVFNQVLNVNPTQGYAVGQRVKELRVARMLTQSELEVRLDIPKTSLSRIESGHLHLNEALVGKLACELNVPMEAISDPTLPLPESIVAVPPWRKRHFEISRMATPEARAARFAIGQRVKEIRKACGLTQPEFAAHFDIPKTSLAQIESGKWYPNEALADKLAREFDVPMEVIIDPTCPLPQVNPDDFASWSFWRKRHFEISRMATPEARAARQAIGQRVKEIRVAHRLTQSELAARLDIPNASLSQIESGKWYPNEALADKLAREFDVPMEVIIDPTCPLPQVKPNDFASWSLWRKRHFEISRMATPEAWAARQAIGQRVKELRTACWLTRSELAARLKIARTSLGDIERGRWYPNEALIDKLAREFDVPLEVILDPIRPIPESIKS